MRIGNIRLTDLSLLVRRIRNQANKDGLVEVTMGVYGDVGCGPMFPNMVGTYNSVAKPEDIRADLLLTWSEVKHAAG